MTHVLNRQTGNEPNVAVSADNMHIVEATGRAIIDGCGGAAVTCLGNGQTRVIDAMHRQARRLAYSHTSFFNNEPAIELAELLVEGGAGKFEKVLFVSSGSEAMEAALKLARQFHVETGSPQRIHYIGRRQSYHGNTLGALSLSGHMARREIFEPVLNKNVSHVSPCFYYRYKESDESEASYVARLEEELITEFLRVGPDTVAAVCLETVAGAAIGCVPALPGYLEAMRRVCAKFGAVLIFDEVMCGMGRTGTQHAWQYDNVAPDIQAIAKGLGGGYQPIGAVLLSKKIYASIAGGSGQVRHGQTYQAHPVACAAALEVQKIVAEQSLLANVRLMGSHLSQQLTERFSDHPNVGDIRGRGLFQALEFVADRESKAPFSPELHLSEKLKQYALRAGLAIYPGSGTADGYRGDHVVLAPPFIVDEDNIAEIVDKLQVAVDKTLREVTRI